MIKREKSTLTANLAKNIVKNAKELGESFFERVSYEKDGMSDEEIESARFCEENRDEKVLLHHEEPGIHAHNIFVKRSGNYYSVEISGLELPY